MVSPEKFIGFLKENKLNFFTGVPDSLLKEFISYLEDHVSFHNRVTAANEGAAIAIAAGHYLATREPGVVYMQNSGLGNAINPLTSLADPKVYAIPMVLVIGWRGEPGVPDEPQHIKQGEITPALLKTLGIPFKILGEHDGEEMVRACVKEMASLAQEESRPCALLVQKNVFSRYEQAPKALSANLMTREEAIEMVMQLIEPNAIVVSTTGKISRELYEIRKREKKGGKDFLTVGSMGHSSQIALGIALQKKDQSVYCFDGDGAVIMHMGSLATTGWMAPANFKHIILNNLAHESVGGQASAAQAISFPLIAKGCGYTSAHTVRTAEELTTIFDTIKNTSGPVMLEIQVNLKSRPDLGRPVETPLENKQTFMDSMS